MSTPMTTNEDFSCYGSALPFTLSLKSPLSFQDPRVSTALRSKYGDGDERLVEQTLTVCSGLDMVNITLCHFVFPDKKINEVSADIKTMRANRITGRGIGWMCVSVRVRTELDCLWPRCDALEVVAAAAAAARTRVTVSRDDR